ncbi:hypothetical protein AVEN_233465-1 [Araneus ventricosus]|uniref:Uncharacterized protein n=1 Tax=Araneus ventricosus TaxID=182803 RepID=A0A4Y2TYY7_ARAVE|nr:hypothetical protein AVEN_233465-1 [Araneus ventricosus]
MFLFFFPADFPPDSFFLLIWLVKENSEEAEAIAPSTFESRSAAETFDPFSPALCSLPDSNISVGLLANKEVFPSQGSFSAVTEESKAFESSFDSLES